jgi:hypothetical protein
LCTHNFVRFFSIPRRTLFVQEERPDHVARLLDEFLAGAA